MELHAPSKGSPTFLIRLRAEPGIDPIHALRHALKTLLRRYGLRAVTVDCDAKIEIAENHND
jgi:hypothetical protein